MNRLAEITSRYRRLRIALVGDFCLDRYFEIDPELTETSIETALPVQNVTNVRSQPGGAGTIASNLVALGVGEIHPLGFCGEDGEGWELRRALHAMPGMRLDHFVQTPERRTFTYGKPLVCPRGGVPRELSRLDFKNWTPTPADVEQRIARALLLLASEVDAVIVLDQVDVRGTGVVGARVLKAIEFIAERHPRLTIIADSRTSLRDYPPVILKMNAAELATMGVRSAEAGVEEFGVLALALARERNRSVIVTLAERGMIGAAPGGEIEHVAALPVRGEIDVVGAGDAVTANLACAFAGGAGLREAMRLASAAASVVVHQLGTTGTASVAEILRVTQASGL